MAPTPPPSCGTLFVAASPLGNLQDISHRLTQTLADVHVVLAEDTRRSRILLSHLGLHKPLQSLHSHNEVAKRDQLVARLLAGDSYLLLSDAGTPGVSDPGAFLVAAAHARAVPVCPIPGPSALTAALSVAGFSPGPHGVLFLGFLPRAGKDRTQALTRLREHPGVAVVFESPERLGKTLAALAQTVDPAEAQAAPNPADRPICLCRELTKLHEEVCLDTVGRLAERFDGKPPKGEITFVLGPKAAPETTPGAQDSADGPGAHVLTAPKSLEAAVRACLDAGVSAKDTAQALAAILGVPRKAAYSLAIAQRSSSR